MISIQRQGIGSAVVRVDLENLEGIATPEQQKIAAKMGACATMVVAGWTTGKVYATRATLDAEGKFYSVTVRHTKA